MTTPGAGEGERWRARKQTGMIAGWPVWYVEREVTQPGNTEPSGWEPFASCTGVTGKRYVDQIVADHNAREAGQQKSLTDCERCGSGSAVNGLCAECRYEADQQTIVSHVDEIRMLKASVAAHERAYGKWEEAQQTIADFVVARETWMNRIEEQQQTIADLRGQLRQAEQKLEWTHKEIDDIRQLLEVPVGVTALEAVDVTKFMADRVKEQDQTIAELRKALEEACDHIDGTHREHDYVGKPGQRRGGWRPTHLKRWRALAAIAATEEGA